jgi:hypothetical protein
MLMMSLACVSIDSCRCSYDVLAETQNFAIHLLSWRWRRHDHVHATLMSIHIRSGAMCISLSIRDAIYVSLVLPGPSVHPSSILRRRRRRNSEKVNRLRSSLTNFHSQRQPQLKASNVLKLETNHRCQSCRLPASSISLQQQYTKPHPLNLNLPPSSPPRPSLGATFLLR